MSQPTGIVLVGPPSSGKSELARCLRAHGGDVIDPEDLTAERSALAHARAVVFVIGATDGIDAPTTYLWREVAAAHVARAIVVTKLDADRADFDETCALVSRLFDPHGCVPITLPVLADDDHLAGFLDLWSGTIREYVGDALRTVMNEPEHVELSGPARERLHDTIAAVGGVDLSRAIADTIVTPVLGFAAPGCVGLHEVESVLDALATAEVPESDPAYWAEPLAGTTPATEVTITTPTDYTDDVDTYLRRLTDARITRESPGDGTTVFTVVGDTSRLVRVPIDVHGLTDGTSTCRQRT
jgi:hypothetical protein